MVGIGLVIFRVILYATDNPLHSFADDQSVSEGILIIILKIGSLVVGISLIAVGSFSLLSADRTETFDAKPLSLGPYNLDEASEGNRLARVFGSRNGKLVCGGLALALITVVTALEIRSSEAENERRQAVRRPVLERQAKIEKMEANLKSDDYSVRREAVFGLLKDTSGDFNFILKTDPHVIDVFGSGVKVRC